MSEEVASADSLLAINAELRDRLRVALQSQASRDWWEQQAYDTLAEFHEAQAEQTELRRALDIALNQIDAEHDLTKALLIKMRRYFVNHGLLTGECVAWMQLKVRYGIGESEADDAAWLVANEQRVNTDSLPLIRKASSA